MKTFLNDVLGPITVILFVLCLFTIIFAVWGVMYMEAKEWKKRK